VRWFVELLIGQPVGRETFLGEKERFIVLTFDPTDEPTPPPLEADLRWVWPVVGGLLALRRLLRGKRVESS
jgi:hypothetical protein